MSRRVALDYSVSSPVGLFDRSLGLVCVTFACALLKVLRLRIVCALMRALRTDSFPVASSAEATLAWAATRHPSLVFIGRAGCIELSLAMALFCLLHRRTATWCVGVRMGPFESHAWVEVNGEPVCEDNDVSAIFRKVITV